MKKFCSHCLRRKTCLVKSMLCDYKCDDYIRDQKALDAHNKRAEKN